MDNETNLGTSVFFFISITPRFPLNTIQFLELKGDRSGPELKKNKKAKKNPQYFEYQENEQFAF